MYIKFPDLSLFTAVQDMVSHVLLTKLLHNGATINTFIDNTNLTDQNFFLHHLESDEEHNEFTNSITSSGYYTDIECIRNINNDSCTIMSLNCQSLNAKFSDINYCWIRLKKHTSLFKCCAFKKLGLKILTSLTWHNFTLRTII